MEAMPIRAYRTAMAIPIYAASHNAKGKMMSSRFLTRGITEFLDIVGSAIAVSAATREHRQARDADLRRLGIDPVQFRGIKRF